MADYSQGPYNGHDATKQYDYRSSDTRRDDYGPSMNDPRYDDDELHPGYHSTGRAPPYETQSKRDYSREGGRYATSPADEPRYHYHNDRHAGAPPPPKHENNARDVPIAEPSNALTPYDEEKAYAEWHRGQAERDVEDNDRASHNYNRRGPPPDDYFRRDDDRAAYYYDKRGEDRGQSDNHDRHGDRRYQAHSDERLPPAARRHHEYDDRDVGKPRAEKEKDLAGTLIGGGAGALLGHELVGKGPLGTIGGAVVGAIAAKGMENYEEKKRREKNDERRRIRRDYDSASYDPRGSYRSSNFYDTEHTSPASGTYDNRYPPRRVARDGPRRHRRKPSSSSDSFTSDD